MYCTDFIFDEIKASDQGFMIVSFDSTSDATVDAGSKIEFTTITSSDKWLKTNSKYSEPLTFHFSIGKVNCDEPDNHFLNADDISFIMRWLVRHDYCIIHFLQDGFEEVCYNCRLQVTEHLINGQVVGFDIEGVADSPFGYGEEITIHLYNSDQIQRIFDPSDEIGETYPYIEMSCVNSGTIEIENIDLCQTTQIKNCKKGEIIEFDENFQITTSESPHSSTLAKDFNYSYFCFGNTFLNRITQVKVKNCNVKLKFKPIRKGVC